MSTPHFTSFGPHTVLVSWEAIITEEIHIAVLQFDELLKNKYATHVLETVPAYRSVAIYLKPSITAEAFIDLLKEMVFVPSEMLAHQTRLVTIPVCYETPFALDLDAVALHTQLAPSEIISKHSEPIYTVYFIGFLPGFPYLGGLSEALHVPRKETARPRLEAGCVGIGGKQTGIYPQESPGGWQIIGKTPITLFQNQQSVLRAGDKIKFEAISMDVFQEISEAIQKKEYVLKISAS